MADATGLYWTGFVGATRGAQLDGTNMMTLDGRVWKSELLFPSETGGYRGGSCLDRPFEEMAKKLKLTKSITPRARRRTFQDLARAAEVRDIVTRSISGHSTEAMQRHCSAVSGKEQKEGLAKVVELAKFREAARLGGVGPEWGDQWGGEGRRRNGGESVSSKPPSILLFFRGAYRIRKR